MFLRIRQDCLYYGNLTASLEIGMYWYKIIKKHKEVNNPHLRWGFTHPLEKGIFVIISN
jgi:hypothetical protein